MLKKLRNSRNNQFSYFKILYSLVIMESYLPVTKESNVVPSKTVHVNSETENCIFKSDQIKGVRYISVMINMYKWTHMMKSMCQICLNIRIIFQNVSIINTLYLDFHQVLTRKGAFLICLFWESQSLEKTVWKIPQSILVWEILRSPDRSDKKFNLNLVVFIPTLHICKC